MQSNSKQQTYSTFFETLLLKFYAFQVDQLSKNICVRVFDYNSKKRMTLKNLVDKFFSQKKVNNLTRNSGPEYLDLKMRFALMRSQECDD